MSEYCPRCGNARYPSAIFCSHCNYKFRSCSECNRFGRRGVYVLDCIYYREGRDDRGRPFCLAFIPKEKETSFCLK